ncbi:MAG: DsbA family protein [Rickettsiales bacterium]|jgi:protein-disulfide isomerase|nr:DsbA family protein [Rickettsiales bacterium]
MNIGKNEKKCCCFGDMPKELKLVYAILAVLTVAVTVLCFKVCSLLRDRGSGPDSPLDEKFSTWIGKNPEAIMNSVNRHVERQRGERQTQQAEKVKKNMDSILSEKNAGVYNPSGKKVVVVFYDYNCGYCKKASQAIEELVRENKNVKVLFRDLPIFGGISTVAAKYSIAVAMVEAKKFFDFHRALMAGNAGDESSIESALVAAKINVEKIRRTLNSKSREIEERVAANMNLAGSLDIGGTPAMVVDGKFFAGYLDASTLGEMLR